jgi:CheY-like chemotaxis protein
MLESRAVAAPLAGKRLLLIVDDAVLAELLAEAAARLGAEATVCASGRAALEALAAGLARGAPSHVAVLDIPLPDLRGREVLQALHDAGVPVVAISAVFRGPRAAGELLRAGAADFFEKPFPVLNLMARLARLMGEGLPGLGLPEDEVTGAIPLGPSDVVAAGAIDDSPYIEVTAEHALSPAPPPLATLAAPLPAPRGPTPAPPAPRAAPPPRRGDLAGAGVPRLLVALHVAQASGALTVERGPVKKILLVEKGSPVYAASNVGAERFGAICVRLGVVSAEDLARLQAEAAGRPGAGPTPRTAELLLERGLLTPPRRAELVAAQIRAITWSTFEWQEGRYDFQLARAPAGLLHLGLSMADLLLEGMVRTSTPARLQADLPDGLHLAPSHAPAFELYALGLRPAEAHLLALCDGTKAVSDLVALSRLPERETRAFLQALRVMRVLDDVDSVLAGTRRMGFM